MKRISQVYLLTFIGFSLLYLFLFRTSLFSSQRVLFYRGNLLLLVAFLLTAAILFVFRRRFKLSFETALAALVLSAALHLAFFVVFPVTFDRSVTMYLLNRLETAKSAQCAGLFEKEMERVFIEEYVKEQQAMRRRISEQSIIKMIEVEKKCVSLTPRAKNFLRFSEMVKKWYALQ